MKNPVEMFREAEQLVRRNGFGWEIDWADRRIPFDDVDEQRFLHEYAWVVFNSGMSNKIIREKWSKLRMCFISFQPKKIVQDEKSVRECALTVFGNKRKIDAIIQVAKKIWYGSFLLDFHDKIKANPLEFLKTLPFIGDITKYHLARNLGFDFIKPDRHLQRLASKFGMTPFELCNVIHQKTGRRLGTIDVILWRYCEQKGQITLSVNRRKEN